MHNAQAIQAARARMSAALESAEKASRGAYVRPAFAAGANRKTGAEITEGTLPLITCSEHACATCARECYAIWHIANIYTNARKKYARATVARRIDPRRYYLDLFAIASATGASVRLNESGDFESAEHLRACFAAARMYQTVRALGYTRRRELLDLIGAAPKNCRILFSCYRDGDPEGDAIRKAPICCVSGHETTCPAQIAAAAGRTWTCAACAAAGCGCWGRDCVIFRAH